MPLSPQYKLKQLVIYKVTGEASGRVEDIDARYDDLADDEDTADGLSDAESGCRGGDVETGLPSESSRHYESRAVAAQMLDGSWVGWTYWYGGGKHGEPKSIPWIEDAYDVTCHEETRVVKVFRKVEDKP